MDGGKEEGFTVATIWGGWVERDTHVTHFNKPAATIPIVNSVERRSAKYCSNFNMKIRKNEMSYDSALTPDIPNGNTKQILYALTFNATDDKQYHTNASFVRSWNGLVQ
jgi:hypothetical protein